MPFTTLDPQTALIVIDLQQGLVGLPGTPLTIAEVIQQARLLLDAFRAHHLPIVLVTAAGGAPGRTDQPSRGGAERPAGWMDLVPELNQQPSDLTVVKRTWGAFTNTGLEKTLKDMGVTQVVVIGVATGMGVESTARQAHEAGFNVSLALDAMTDLNADVHLNSATRIFPRLGETGTTQELLALLPAPLDS